MDAIIVTYHYRIATQKFPSLCTFEIVYLFKILFRFTDPDAWRFQTTAVRFFKSIHLPQVVSIKKSVTENTFTRWSTEEYVFFVSLMHPKHNRTRIWIWSGVRQDWYGGVRAFRILIWLCRVWGMSGFYQPYATISERIAKKFSFFCKIELFCIFF